MDRKIEKKRFSWQKIAGYGALGLLMVFIIYNFVLSGGASKLNVERERLTVSTVQFGPFIDFIPVTGTVEPIQTFFLDVSNGGRIVEKFVEEGAFLEENDPILKLDNTNLTLSVMYNQAQLFQQINSLRNTRLQFEQVKLSNQATLLDVKLDLNDRKRQWLVDVELYSKGMISKNQYLRSKEVYEAAVEKYDLTKETISKDSVFRTVQIASLENSVATLEENLDVAKSQLENLTVKAPITGQLTSLNAEIGQSINSGQNLGRIDNINEYKIRAQIDEHYIARVAVGQQGTFEFDGKQYLLEIKTVYPQVQNGRFETDMVFVGKQPNGIRRGQTVHIKLELSEETSALIVERGGFFQTTGGQWIFVIDESAGVARKRQITLGRQNPQVFEVKSGLKEGEKVITSSYDNYGDNDILVLN